MITVNKMPTSQGWNWFKSAYHEFKRSPLFWMLASFVPLIVESITSQFVPPYFVVVIFIPTSLYSIGFVRCYYYAQKNQNVNTQLLFEDFKNSKTILRLLKLKFFLFLSAISAFALLFLANAVFFQVHSKDYLDTIELLMTENMIMIPESLHPALIFDGIFTMIWFSILIMAFIFSTALVGLYDLSPWRAIELSFQANLKNVGSLLTYSVLLILGLLLSISTLGFGFLVTVPLSTMILAQITLDFFGPPHLLKRKSQDPFSAGG